MSNSKKLDTTTNQTNSRQAMTIKKTQKRFSLLLLLENEIYWEDYACSFFVTTSGNPSFPGRLHFCSHSLIFVPDSNKFPIVRFCYDKLTKKPAPFSPKNSCAFNPFDTNHLFSFRCSQGSKNFHFFSPSQDFFSLTSPSTKKVVEMKTQNKDHPYRFRELEEEVVFGLNFKTTQEFLGKIQPVLDIWKVDSFVKYYESLSNQKKVDDDNKKKQQSYTSLITSYFSKKSGLAAITSKPILSRTAVEEELQKLYDNSIMSFLFDTTWKEDYREQKLFEAIGRKVKPLVEIPGDIYITNKRIYFQPFNNISSKPVKKLQIASIQRITKRRHLLRHTGIEILFEKSSVYFNLKSVAQRDQLYNVLCKLLPPKLKMDASNYLEIVTERWQTCEISNFDYIMFLNFLADRSFNDLTQYPVFPWIIQDYTSNSLNLEDPKTFRDLSKPMGALNPTRLERLKKRYQEMPEMDIPKFIYGTHYSNPGYVLFYLVRQIPEYMLKLQNGKFDAPDRSFYAISETFQNALNNDTDVKELIPEFYFSTGKFLQNKQGLELGIREDSNKVNDVILPNWAKDTTDFIYHNRQALESAYVSNRIHEWIDLIFGFKQRGEESIKANNLFYYLTYEGSVDLETINDPVKRKSYQMQIAEFGQTPRQLFTSPHPKRKINPKTFNPNLDLQEITGKDEISILPKSVLNIISQQNEAYLAPSAAANLSSPSSVTNSVFFESFQKRKSPHAGTGDDDDDLMKQFDSFSSNPPQPKKEEQEEEPEDDTSNIVAEKKKVSKKKYFAVYD